MITIIAFDVNTPLGAIVTWRGYIRRTLDAFGFTTASDEAARIAAAGVDTGQGGGNPREKGEDG